jgi:hypothetical protein
MSKEQRDAEIERIVDIAVADENSRLAEGGAGPGDMVDNSQLIEHDGQKYLATKTCSCGPNDGCSNCPKPERDEYREMIETPAPAEEPLVMGTTHTPDRKAEILRLVDQIRSRVVSHKGQARTDVGYLLEVIDAYEAGRL